LVGTEPRARASGRARDEIRGCYRRLERGAFDTAIGKRVVLHEPSRGERDFLHGAKRGYPLVTTRTFHRAFRNLTRVWVV
jgi:hypothetical protein